MSLLPTGEQYEIGHGDVRVVVTQVGATLRSVRVGRRELLWTFAEDQIPLNSQGLQLFPWPNRVADGAYTFDGVDEQLDISELPRHTALHGLNKGRAWDLVSHDDTSVVQRHTFYPENGWSGILTATLTHRVTAEGLQVEVDVVNDGPTPLHFGYGVHPYFDFGDITDVELLMPFEQELRVDPERLLPLSLETVSDEFDFRRARAVGDAVLDTAFRTASSGWAVELRGREHGLQVWADASLPWLQVYTTRPERHAIAVEPMTCGPDAYNAGPTHADLITLAPGESSTHVWGIRPL